MVNSKFLRHFARAVDIVRQIFSGVVDAAALALLEIQAVLDSLVTPPCSPWVPQAQQDAVTKYTAKLAAASSNFRSFASPIVAKMDWASLFVQEIVSPTSLSVVIVSFLLLVLIGLASAISLDF